MLHVPKEKILCVRSLSPPSIRPVQIISFARATGKTKSDTITQTAHFFTLIFPLTSVSLYLVSEGEQQREAAPAVESGFRSVGFVLVRRFHGYADFQQGF